MKILPMRSESGRRAPRLGASLVGARAAAVLASILFVACAGSPPVPLIVLENPATGQQVSFYREIPFKVPANYDEAKHIASWRADQAKAGFTKQIKP